MTELHVHLDGSLRPETVWELAAEQGIALPAKTVEELRTLMQAPVPCGSLGEYLSRFAVSKNCLQTEAALERVAFELAEDMADSVPGRNHTVAKISAEPENTVDLLILGDSESHTSMSPMELWGESGVVSVK